MCGIVTVVTPTERGIDPSVLRAMVDTLARRGPDDFGFTRIEPATGRSEHWQSAFPVGPLGGVLMGHRRLSIIDLTSGGHQPMSNDDGSLTIVFNGEIYNFVELRDELKAQGIAFSTHSDTEVLLKAYDHWGAGAVERFNGMWAFALWDARARKLVISRDRFGVKPLYYTVVDGVWLFASEIKAILPYPGAFTGFDDQRIRSFVHNGEIDTDDGTAFRNIRAVPPGVVLELQQGRLSERRFWRLQIDERHAGLPDERLIADYRALLTDSVRLRVRSDVPIGTMLSGGLDSTSVTALANDQHPAEGFHHTITACWPGWVSDEEQQASLLCQSLGLQSHRVYPTAETLGAALENVAYVLDEPFFNPVALVQYRLMERANQLGVKVVLNGHGADEALAGYPDVFVPPFLAGLLLTPAPLHLVREQRAFRGTTQWTNRAIRYQFTDGLRRLWQRALSGGVAGQHCSVATEKSLSPLSHELVRAFTSTLLPTWLRMEDRMSMAWSVESRLPFMDYRLVEFTFNLPDRLKLRGGYTKYILRQAMRDKLPDAIVGQRHKVRFSTPYPQWMRDDWRPLLEEHLLGSSQLDSYVEMPLLRTRLRSFLKGEAGLGSGAVWWALSAELWLRAFSGRTTGPN